MTRTRNSSRRIAALGLIALLALGGCVSRDMSDLEAYASQILARPGGRIEPLPEMKPYERYLYRSAEEGLRDPFTQFAEERQEKVQAAVTAEQQRFIDEISNRNREELERYELDSLRMVGTLEREEDLWAIIRDQTGTVHKVQVGNYMGRNYGKILDISEDQIELREIVKDPNGNWEERQAVLALAEE